MHTLKQTFEESFKKYKGENADLLSVEHTTSKILEELPRYFAFWMEHNPVLLPIAKVNIEVDSLGYTYTMLIDENGICMEGEAASLDPSDLGLIKLFKTSPELVMQFMAHCYQKALPEACQSPEFMSLPRASNITFSVGEHSGWECDEVYVFSGERYEIDHGNVRLKRLRLGTTCITEPDTPQRKFMDHLQNIDIHKCSDELLPAFNELLIWLSEQQPEPLERIMIAWSSDFTAATAMGALQNESLYRWPGTFNFYKWFSTEHSEDFDHDDLENVRTCISNKIAEIACITAEKCVESEAFIALPKSDVFFMEVRNRTAPPTPRFYPFI